MRKARSSGFLGDSPPYPIQISPICLFHYTPSVSLRMVDKYHESTRNATARHRAITYMMNKTTGLLDLPPELRNRIYDLVILHGTDMMVSATVAWTCYRQPTITRTCRQVRSESLSIFYATKSSSSSAWLTPVTIIQVLWTNGSERPDTIVCATFRASNPTASRLSATSTTTGLHSIKTRGWRHS